MDITTMLLGITSRMSAAALAADYGAAVASKALDSQKESGNAVLRLLEASRPDPAYTARATGKGFQVDCFA